MRDNVFTQVTAIAQRSGDWWAITVPEIDGIFTQAKRLDQIEGLVQEAASLLGYQVQHVQVEPILSEQDEQLLEQLLTAKHEAITAQERASALARSTVATLRNQGFTVRDVASIIGVTPQRVSMLSHV